MKKLQVIFSLFVFLSSSGINAQFIFQKTYGGTEYDEILKVRQTTDGYIIAGYTRSFGAGLADALLLKTDASGNFQWSKTYGGSGGDYARDIFMPASGGFILAGHTTSYGAGSEDGCLIRTDDNGNIIWSKTYGGTNEDVFYSIRPTPDNGYIIGGYTNSFGAGDYDGLLVKTDSSGNILWSKTYGGTLSDAFNVIEIASDGGYILAGKTASSGAGSQDAYIIKTDSSGNVLWSKTFGGTLADDALSIVQIPSGQYVFSGVTSSFGVGGYDILLTKIDASGFALWGKVIGGTSTDHGSSIQYTSDGGFLVAGVTSSFGNQDLYLLKTDASGNILWSKTEGGTNIENEGCLIQTADGGYILAGITSSFGSGLGDGYMIKTNSGGVSGCNEVSQTFTSSIPATLSFSAPTTVNAISLTVTSPSFISSASAIATTVLCYAVGIDELGEGENGISLFPNPATDELSVNGFLFSAKTEINIYNTLGEKILSKEIAAGEKEVKLNVKNLAAGIYVVRINDEKINWAGKFVKE